MKVHNTLGWRAALGPIVAGSVIYGWALAADEPIRSNVEYLMELECLAIDDQAALAYLESTWKCLAAKVEPSGGACWPSGAVQEDFRRATGASDAMIERVVYPQLQSWQRYIGVRRPTGTHKAWEDLLRSLAQKDVAVAPFARRAAKISPDWQYFNRQVGIPGISDDFPLELKRDPEDRSGPALKLSKGAPVKIRVTDLKREVRIVCKLDDDHAESVHVQSVHVLVEASKGGFGAYMEPWRAWDRARSEDPMTGGRFEKPSGVGMNLPIVIFHRELPFAGLDRPSSGTVYLWQGDKEMPKGLREKAQTYRSEQGSSTLRDE